MAMTPATDAIMGAVPPEKFGVGSAVNDTTRELGGALGIAILGSLWQGAYAGRVADATALLPPGASRRFAAHLPVRPPWLHRLAGTGCGPAGGGEDGLRRARWIGHAWSGSRSRSPAWRGGLYLPARAATAPAAGAALPQQTEIVRLGSSSAGEGRLLS